MSANFNSKNPNTQNPDIKTSTNSITLNSELSKEIPIKKETVGINKTVYEKTGHTTVETSVNVPDINPDILKVLDVSGFPSITEKSVHNGKISLRGKINITVLYTPDGDTISKVKPLSTSADFSYTADIGTSDTSLQLSAEVEPENFSYTLINSRKISLRCILNINTKVHHQNSVEIPVYNNEEQSDLCVQSQRLRLCTNNITAENIIPIKYDCEIPSDKPPIGEVLKINVFPQPAEFTITDGITDVKGQLKICCVYSSLNDGEICFETETVPFEESLDVSGLEEDMEGEIDYSLSDLYYEVRDNSDGEPGIIGLDINLTASVRCHKIYEPNIICDVFSTRKETKVNTVAVDFEELIDNTTSQFTHKTNISLPEDMPELSRICDAELSADIENITIGHGEITVNGTMNIKILYLSQDGDTPLCTFSKNTTFTHSVAVSGISDNAVIDAKIFTEHISYNMTGSRNIDMRIVMGLCIRSFILTKISMIKDIDILDNIQKHNMPSIVICFPKNGDTLWDLAKKYRTTPDALKECNNISDDELPVGQKIKIIR